MKVSTTRPGWTYEPVGLVVCRDGVHRVWKRSIWKTTLLSLALAALIALLTYHGLPEDLEFEVAVDPCAIWTCRVM